MRTLATFYQSKEWRKTVRRIRLERLDKNGQTICEYCGKPIVKEYDCIGHHVEHLTEGNVNDVMVSLNPDNIQLVHHICHNKIHEKLGSKERQVYLVYGPPLAGKRAYVDKAMASGDLIIDIDSIWECVSGLKRYEKPPRLTAVVFGIHKALLESVRYRKGKWQNAYIIGGYPIEGERERLAKELGAREVFVQATQEECTERLLQADDARDKKDWKRYIDEWFERYTPPLEEN